LAESLDAACRFAGRLPCTAREVVRTASGVRLEIQEALFLTLQSREQRQQRDVLVHVREVPGVKAVTVFQRIAARCRFTQAVAAAPAVGQAPSPDYSRTPPRYRRRLGSRGPFRIV